MTNNKPITIKATYDAVVSSPIGALGIKVKDHKLYAVENLGNCVPYSTAMPFINEVCKQISAYFSNSSHHFSLPLHLEGTPFQQRVWQALNNIPAGTVLTYGDLAKQLKSSPRAVGNACRKNPVPIVIPCHRIVGHNSLGGYSGNTGGIQLAIKAWLLEHEGK